ncbi:MAG: hypothetical protein ABSG78_02355 [Verrucomicrobiota bacterium]
MRARKWSGWSEWNPEPAQIQLLPAAGWGYVLLVTQPLDTIGIIAGNPMSVSWNSRSMWKRSKMRSLSFHECGPATNPSRFVV